MADDDHLNVDLDVGSNELEPSLRRAFELMQVGLQRAEGIQRAMAKSADEARRFTEQMKVLTDRATAAPVGTKAYDEAMDAIAKRRKADEDHKAAVREEIQLQKELSLARGATARTRDSNPLPGGRTVGQANNAEAALRDAITGINTTTEQLTARLAIATGKAMERLLSSTTEAIERSQLLALQKQEIAAARMSVSGALDARVTNARVAEERQVALSGRGSTLAERQANARERSDAEYENRQRTLAANRMRRDAERENRERDGLTRVAALRERTEAEWENRTRDREVRIAALRERAAAEDENRQRTLAANRLRRDAERENRERDGLTRAAALRERTQAEWENRQRDRDYKTGFNRMYADAQLENRRFDQRAAEARRRSPEYLQEQASRSFAARSAAFDANGGADQFAFQARLAANYAAFGMLTGAIRGSMAAIIEFDDNLAKFQAITGTANVEMDGFKKGLLGVAESSKFSVNELTQVAIALGQTGLTASEVTKALKPVADLAAASGSTLQESVEAITGVLGAYNMEAGRAGEVADVFVAALNRTKLSMGQLQLGIQYAANIARDSNISFSELTASIGAISQAGVKSGSTIGTGMRQLITELSAPTEKLRGVLKEVGIDLEAVDLRTQGFSGVLQNLQKAGFGTAEALRAFDLRAAAAYSALVGQADKLGSLQQEFLLTSAASEGAAKANESLSASGQRLTNTLFNLADTAFSPLVKVMAVAVGGTADLVKGFEGLGPTLPLIAAGVGSIATAFVALKSAQLLGGAATLLGGASMATLAPVLTAATAIAGGGALIYYLANVKDEAGQALEALDKLKGTENILISSRQTLGQRSTELERTISTLIDRRDKLNSDPVLRQTAVIEAQKAFGDLGLAVDPARTSIDELIKSLQGLRGEMGKELPVMLGEQIAVVTQKIAELQKLQDARSKANGPRTDLLTMEGMTVAINSDPSASIRALGPTYSTMADVIQDPKLLGDNPIGYGAPLRRDAQDEVNRLRLEASKATPAEATRLNKRIEDIEAALKKFNDVVNAATETQASEIQRKSLQQALTTAELQKSPDYLATLATRDELKGQQDRNVLAAAAGNRGYAGFEAMRGAARMTDEAAKAQLAGIKQTINEFAAGGANDEERAQLRKAAEDAYREVTTGLEAIIRGNTKEVVDRFGAAAPAQKAYLNARIRSDEAQLAVVNRQAGLTRDPAQVAAYQKLAEQLQGEINAAREQLFKIEQGTTPDDVVNQNPEIRAKRDEIREQGKAKLDGLATTYAEINKRLQEQLLTYQIEGEQSRKSLLETQIKGLEKVRDDVRSTPEQMRAAVEEINRLLGEVAKIGKSVNSLTFDREALKTRDQGPLPPSVTFSGGSVQQQIVDTLRASGASEERIRYALASGQIESGYAPDVISGARRSSAGATGLFQFMPKTWRNQTGEATVSTDVGRQIQEFQKFTDRNAGTFQSNMGRAATAEELYLMHQQGSAGAMALLRAGNGSALGALTGVYGNAGTARSAITGNGGRADMTADEFVQLIVRKFRTAETTVGNPFSTTTADDLKAKRQRADDQTAQEAENAKAANEKRAADAERRTTLANLRKEDRALSEQYDTQLTLAKRVQDPAKVVSANADAYKTLGDLFKNAQARDAATPDGGSPDDREAARTATRRRFADLYSQQGLNQAETAGKAAVKGLNDELDQAVAKKKELERPENLGREGNTAMLNALNEQINTLQKRKELEGEYEANQAKIIALEQTLKEMKAQGLDTDKDTLAVRERLRDLSEQQKRLEPSRNFAGQQARTEKSYSEAFTGAVDSFEKSRGIRNPLGDLVGPVEAAQRDITASLNVVGNAFDSLFTNMFNGSMKAGDALKKFASDILGGLMSQISRSLTNDIFKSLFSGGSGGDGGGSIFSAIGSFFGGGSAIPSFANGGPIRMAGGGAVNRDSVPILAMPGEYMLRKSAVDAIGREQLDQVNALGNSMVSRAPKVDAKQKFGGAEANANVYVVDRDQVPQPGPSDFVYAIGENIQKGGSIRQLIKRVAAGG